MFESTIRAGCIVFSLACLTACGGGSSDTKQPPTESPQVVWARKNAHAFSGTDPSNTDYSDLQAFGDAIGNARIVSLAEPDHGSGTVFDMKTRLVKYLHEQKGFDVIMLESSSFATNRIWQLAQTGQNVDDLAPDNIFFMYSKSAEGRKLLQYIDAQRTGAHPLILSSLSRPGGGSAIDLTDLFPMLETFLTSRNSTLPGTTDWDTYKHYMLNSVMPIPQIEPNPSQQSIDTAFAVSDQLESDLCSTQADSYVFPDSPGVWCILVKGLHGAASDIALGQYTGETGNAANFQWLDDHLYSGHKIIIWGHYRHLGKGTQSPAYGGTNNLGNALNGIYGNQMYVAAFTASSGSSLMWWNGAHTAGGGFNTDTFPVETDSPGGLEYALHSLSQPNLFIDSRSSPPPSYVTSMPVKADSFEYSDLLGFTPNTTMGSAYDGLFYIDTSAPAAIDR